MIGLPLVGRAGGFVDMRKSTAWLARKIAKFIRWHGPCFSWGPYTCAALLTAMSGMATVANRLNQQSKEAMFDEKNRGDHQAVQA
jgi:hypothetical protein